MKVALLCSRFLVHSVEYVDGGTLAELIVRYSRPLPWVQRIMAALDIARGMNYLHSRRIVHRDLTSHNCLVWASGHVVVVSGPLLLL